MADSIKKTVQYELSADNTSFIRSINNAINKINTLDSKLARVSAKTKTTTTGSLGRTSAVAGSVHSLQKVRDTLLTASGGTLSKEQLAVVKSITSVVASLSKELGNAGNASKITDDELTKIVANIKKIEQTVKSSGITDAANQQVKAAKEVEKAEKEKAKQQERAAKKAKKASEKAAKAAEAAYRKQAKEAMQAYTETVKNAVKALTNLITVMRTVFRVGYRLMQFAADFGETINKFEILAGDAKEALTEFADEMTRTLGLDAQDIYEAVAAFKSVANSIKLANDQSITFTKTLSMLAVDLSSLYNTSIEQAINALTAGMHGVLKPLKTYNVYLYESNLEQTRITHGITKQISEMNESEKILLRYLAVLDQTKEAQGDMARTLDSAANQLRICRAQFNTLKRSLGQIVTVIGLTVVPALNILFAGLSKVATLIARSLGYELNNIANFFDDTASNADDSTEAIEETASALKGLTDLDEINIFNQTTSESVLDTETGGLAIDKGLLKALHTYDNYMSQIENSIDDMATKVAQAFQGTMLMDAVEFIVGSINAIANAFKYMMENFDTFEPIIKTVINLLTIFAGLYIASKIKTWTTSFLAFAKSITNFSIQLPVKQQYLTGCFDKISESVSGTTVAFSLFMAAATYAIASSIFDSMDEETRKVAGALGILVAALTAGAIAWMAFHGAMSWGTAVPIISTAVAFGAASIKATIPKMAKGGVVDGPTVAMIGEGRYNEAVVPLGNSPQFREMQNTIASRTAEKVAQTPFNQSGQNNASRPLILQVNGRELGRIILPYTLLAQPQVAGVVGVGVKLGALSQLKEVY